MENDRFLISKTFFFPWERQDKVFLNHREDVVHWLIFHFWTWFITTWFHQIWVCYENFCQAGILDRTRLTYIIKFQDCYIFQQLSSSAILCICPLFLFPFSYSFYMVIIFFCWYRNLNFLNFQVFTEPNIFCFLSQPIILTERIWTRKQI